MNKEVDCMPQVARDTQDDTQVEFERTSLAERLKAKFLSAYFFKNVVWYFFRLALLIGVAFVIIQPFITMIIQSIMAPKDFIDPTVVNVPRNLSIDIYKAIFTDLPFFGMFFKTLALSLGIALVQTFVCCLVGYGLAKFKFRGAKLVFFAVILTLVIPHGTLQAALFQRFRYFDILGIFKFLSGGTVTNIGWLDNILSKIHILPFTQGLNLMESVVPLFVMAICGLGFKNGLYIFLLRQFFRGVPDELEESAYLDGANTFRTFVQVILPISIPMMITVFLFSFCWQWTDDFYIPLFFSATTEVHFMTDIASSLPLPSLTSTYTNQTGSSAGYFNAMRYACGLLACTPLIVLFLFCQKYLVQGIERSGIVG